MVLRQGRLVRGLLSALAAVFVAVGMGSGAEAAGLPSLSIQGGSPGCYPYALRAYDVIDTFTVTLSSSSTAVVTVQYATEGGTARSPGDFTAVSGTLSFSPGTTTKNVPVTVHCRKGVKPLTVLTFYMNLGNPVNATIANGRASSSIFYDPS